MRKNNLNYPNRWFYDTTAATHEYGQPTMFDIIPTIDVDIALVSALILLGIGGALTAFGLNKWNNQRTSLTRNNSGGESLISLGSGLTFLAFIPLTIYTTTRAFPNIYQQVIVAFIILGLLGGVSRLRRAINGINAVIVSIVVTIALIPLRLLALVYANTIGRLRNPDDT